MNKRKVIKATFSAMFHFPLTRAAVFSRQPFPRWPYQHAPEQMQELARLLLSVKTEGSVMEIGCNQGWTSAFLLETMRSAGVSRPFVGIDTFRGFLAEDVKAEYQRGKPNGIFTQHFVTCNAKWYRYSLQRCGYDAQAIEGDCSEIDYSRFFPIAFCLLDVDLYRPTMLTLKRLWPHVAENGIVVVDDCDSAHELWDGAADAYRKFCRESGIERETIHRKFGILRKQPLGVAR